MLKKSRILAMTAATLGLIGLAAFRSLGHGNERGEAKATIGGAKITISYARPELKGRNPLKLIQPGKLWRIGADMPTTIESSADLDFGGTRVPKGKHILLARYLEPGKWSLVFSSKDASHYDPSAKIAEIPVEFREGNDPAEEVTIRLTSQGGRGIIDIAWGKLRMSAAFAPAN